MKAAIYVRVSGRHRTSGQAWEQNPKVQQQPLMDLIAARGWELAGVYEDRASGASKSRPGLDLLMEAARRGEIGAVVVWRFDRFARSVSHLVRTLEEFDALRIHFVSHQETFDTGSPMGRAMYQISAAFAEMERNLIAERTRAGMDYARKHGTKSGTAIGRPRAVFNRDEVRRLRAAGQSIRAIARTLAIGTGTVYAALRGPDA